MKTEQQRIAIAEACELKISHVAQGGGVWMRSAKPFIGSWTTRDDEGSYEYGRLPDYLNDLNAMSEAEKAISSGRAVSHWHHLFDVVRRDLRGVDCPTVIYMHRATAAQRAEALLKCINKWEASA